MLGGLAIGSGQRSTPATAAATRPAVTTSTKKRSGNRGPDRQLRRSKAASTPKPRTPSKLGLKGQFLDQRLTLNSALFHTTFDDFQLNTFTGLGFTVGNVKKVVSSGVELESFLTLTDGVFLTAGATYTDARYDDDLVPANATLRTSD